MFEIKELPPNQGLTNRAARFVLQTVDKVLYPSTDRVIAGGEDDLFHAPITQRQLNELAQEKDLRRFKGWGDVEAVIGAKGAIFANTYKKQAEGTLFAVESIPLERGTSSH